MQLGTFLIVKMGSASVTHKKLSKISSYAVEWIQCSNDTILLVAERIAVTVTVAVVMQITVDHFFNSLPKSNCMLL